MTNIIKLAAAGALAGIALIVYKTHHRKPAGAMKIGPKGGPIAGPRKYVSAAGDKLASVAARFGTTSQALTNYAQAQTGKPTILLGQGRPPVLIPPGLGDLGARAGANGVTL